MPGFFSRIRRRDDSETQSDLTQMDSLALQDAQQVEAAGRVGPISDVLYSAAGNSADMPPVLEPELNMTGVAEGSDSTLVALRPGSSQLMSPSAAGADDGPEIEEPDQFELE